MSQCPIRALSGSVCERRRPVLHERHGYRKRTTPHPCAASYPAGTSAATGPRSEVAGWGLIMARRSTRTAATAGALLLIAAAMQHAPTSFDGVMTFCRTPCDQSLNPAARHAVLTAIGTFRSLRTGNPGERAVAQAACAMINEGFYPDQSREDFVAQLHRQPPVQKLPGADADAYVTRLADAYAVAQAHGGISRFYTRSCQMSDRGLSQRSNSD